MHVMTWPQAKNRLITGVIKKVKYYQCYTANNFIAINGKIYSIDNDGKSLDQREPFNQEEKFYVPEE